jgi:hypothetical protein
VGADQSFAQFEREMTGERIRDKIAASKARGMWMGGVVPLGYRVEERKLIVIPTRPTAFGISLPAICSLGPFTRSKSNLPTKASGQRSGSVGTAVQWAMPNSAEGFLSDAPQPHILG